MAKINIPMNKKTALVMGGVILTGAVLYVLCAPLLSKVRALTTEVKALDSELAAVREVLDKGKTIKRGAGFLPRNEVSLAIDEITKVGATMNINFLSTNPQKIRLPEQSKYPVLPIRMEIQSEYEDLGAFFGALENLEKSVVTVRGFSVRGDAMALPRLVTDIVLEIHLGENESE